MLTIAVLLFAGDPPTARRTNTAHRKGHIQNNMATRAGKPTALMMAGVERSEW